VKYHPKHVEQLTDLNKIYSVASFWLITKINMLRCTVSKTSKEHSLFKSVNCSTCFGWYFTHPQELITMALMRSVLLPIVKVAGLELSLG
jgi:hypothetical protein